MNYIGTEYYPNQIYLIREGAIEWQPYEDLLDEMPVEVLDEIYSGRGFTTYLNVGEAMVVGGRTTQDATQAPRFQLRSSSQVLN